MGLQLSVFKDNNFLYKDMINAYWSIDQISYDVDKGYMQIHIYPSREAKKHQGLSFSPMVTPDVDHNGLINPVLQTINITFVLSDVFTYIPLDLNEQKTILYNYFKKITQLPFEDVFESQDSTTSIEE